MSRAIGRQATGVEAVLAEPTVHTLPDFRQIFLTEESYVLRSLRRLGVAETDVEDVGHEVFLSVYRKLGTYDSSLALRPWLFAFCVRLAANYRRRNVRTQETANELIDPAPHGDELLAQEERRQLVLTALEALEFDRRVVFVMHVLDEVPVPEVARVLNLPLGTAYTRLKAARVDFANAVRRTTRRRGMP